MPGYDASDWFGLGAPKNTPAEIIDKLNGEINAGLADPKLKARLADPGATVNAGSPTEFGKPIADETEKWRKVVKFSGAKGGAGKSDTVRSHGFNSTLRHNRSGVVSIWGSEMIRAQPGSD